MPGETVLVDGSSGGVGSFAVQLLAARGGRVVSTLGAADPEALAAFGSTGPEVVADTGRELIGRLADQVAAGRLSVDVTTVLSLDQATDGLRTIATGNARGKIVVSLAG